MLDYLIIEMYIEPNDIYMDVFCWDYTKNDIYTVKYMYWVARNVLYKETIMGYSESSIRSQALALQAFSWKENALYVIYHLIRNLSHMSIHW